MNPGSFPDSAVEVAISLIFAALVLATAFVLALPDRRPERPNLIARIRTWWMIFALLGGALLLGRTAIIVVLAFVSFLALKEYFTVIPTRRADRLVLLVAYLAIPVQYTLIGYDRYGLFIVFVPVYMLMAVPAAMVVRGETEGFLRAASTIHWGLMACVFAVGHAAALFALSEPGDIETGAGLFLVLMLLTGLNDVAQYVAGRTFGRTKIAPAVSPNKTLEGLVGGVIMTAWIAAVVAPYLTPFSPGFAAAAVAGGAIGSSTSCVGVPRGGKPAPGAVGGAVGAVVATNSARKASE